MELIKHVLWNIQCRPAAGNPKCLRKAEQIEARCVFTSRPPTASPARVMSGNWQIIRRPRLIRTGDSAQVKRTRWSESKADRQPERATSRRGEREKHNLWAVNGLIKFEERVQIKSEGKREVRLLYLSSWKMRKQQQQKKLLVCSVETLVGGVLCDKVLTLMSN